MKEIGRKSSLQKFSYFSMNSAGTKGIGGLLEIIFFFLFKILVQTVIDMKIKSPKEITPFLTGFCLIL